MAEAKDNSSQEEKSIWEIYNKELCLWIQFMKAVYGVQLQPVPANGKMHTTEKETIPTTTVLDSSGNFLESQITSVMALAKNGDELPPTNNGQNGNVTFSETPAKVIAYLGHIKMEYQADAPEKFQATGFKYDYNDKGQVDQAMRERAAAALSLAYAAKAKGWKKVNFDNTEDPVDRLMLMKACDYVGLSFGKEKTYTSIPMNKNIQPTNDLINGALLNQKIDNKITGPERTYKALDIIDASIVGHMNNFILTKDMPLDNNQKRPSPSPRAIKTIIIPTESEATKEPEREAVLALF